MKNKSRILLILITILGLFSCANSDPYNAGEVKVTVKNNMPCLYINDQDLIGSYRFSISPYNQDDSEFEYRNTLTRNYPTKDNCVLVNQTNFKNIQMNANLQYEIVLEVLPPENPPFFYKGKFCVRKAEEKTVIQKAVSGRCQGHINETEEDKLGHFFKKIFQ